MEGFDSEDSQSGVWEVFLKLLLLLLLLLLLCLFILSRKPSRQSVYSKGAYTGGEKKNDYCDKLKWKRKWRGWWRIMNVYTC